MLRGEPVTHTELHSSSTLALLSVTLPLIAQCAAFLLSFKVRPRIKGKVAKVIRSSVCESVGESEKLSGELYEV